MKKIEAIADSISCTDNIAIVNSRDSGTSRFVLCFGAYGWTRLMVWADHLEDALDECVDWIAEHAPGLLMDEQVAEAYKEAFDAAIAEGMSEEDADEHAREEAETDMTCAGNCGNYLASWEWGIVAENPTRAQVLEMLGRVQS